MNIIKIGAGLLLFTLIGFGGIYLTNNLAGQKPTKTIKADKNDKSSIHSVKIEKTLIQILPETKDLQEKIKSEPKNLKFREELAQIVKSEYEKSVKSGVNSKELSFYYLESLLEILKLDQQNKAALIGLADIAFEKQIFVKASEYYQAYLELEPKDLSARARYASALTFASNFEQALKELEQILKENPKHFQALAYKTITLAQKGEIKNALQIAKIALENAPSNEAQDRFNAYLKTLEAESKQSFLDLRKYLINNSVTSGKFVEIKNENAQLKIYLSNFPMQQMPEFAKVKFINKVKELIALETQLKVSEVLFVDFETDQVMLVEKLGS